MPRGYNAQYTFDFNDIKKRILSNARAYYAHRFPEAQRYDFITSSIPPTDSRDSKEYRGGLIVYPDPKSNDWVMLYKSHSWPAVEDTAFEIKSWLEEKMRAVFDKTNEGEKWAGTKNKSKDELSGSERKSTAGEDQMEDVETAEDSSKSTDTTAGDRGDGTGTGDKGEDKEVPKQPEDSTAGDQAEAASDTTIPIRKRKSAADEEKDRKKSMKNDEEQRVFVGEKDDPPTKEEKKGPVDPVVVPTELKLPPTTEK
ncbi:hypothetical protein J4E81_007354 [Alternaria sp. BMP 2799]|uniref:uncharacterized protein n=1 Tax=Alternaria metachromatica TaxID=283354 RepID=UPI0020C36F98|nr:uncharacterized protein J4E83_001796 [Alternaria metachromatica]XP_051353603.1 uncharacterized protein J4E92_004373 [Alternaria infectoria]KAI4634477.1 hypothetical protein J4E83_001796 [Alternaria metachromatica]KAI4691827.1 hypothetical protein J4E81_007354 [Alternaria sp. BMP 2799]KAI4930541.1 hypothetical protein J4E92_004373 [Alternaria infectoria]